jgi:hypothetical protein
VLEGDRRRRPAEQRLVDLELRQVVDGEQVTRAAAQGVVGDENADERQPLEHDSAVVAVQVAE